MRAVLVLGALLLALPAWATIMVPLDLRKLTQTAEVVVAGHITDKASAWTSTHDAIYTDVTLHVERVLNGPLTVGQDLVVRNEGGTVGGVGMMVHGAPRFVVGEEVVLFVERRGAARYVVGMAQGKLDLVNDHGEKKIVRRMGDVAFTRTPTTEEQTLPARTLDELDAAVKRIAREPRP